MNESEQKLCRLLYEQAKKCQTTSGATLLFAMKRCLDENPQQVVEGMTELWQVADHLSGMLVNSLIEHLKEWADNSSNVGRS